jgi:hypothetical protein
VRLLIALERPRPRALTIDEEIKMILPLDTLRIELKTKGADAIKIHFADFTMDYEIKKLHDEMLMPAIDAMRQHQRVIENDK